MNTVHRTVKFLQSMEIEVRKSSWMDWRAGLLYESLRGSVLRVKLYAGGV